jgi:hypothetical protein
MAETKRFRRFRDAQDHAGILHREEPFGNNDVEINRKGQRADGDQQRHG